MAEPKPQQGWTPEHRDRAIALWTSGLSATEISAKLDSEFRIKWSRNAVIGLIHRAKLPPRMLAAGHGVEPKRRTNPRIHHARGALGLQRAREAAAQGYTPPPKPVRVRNLPKPVRAPLPPRAERPRPMDEIPATARPWIERPSSGCKWPFGEGENLLSCCALIARGSYCEFHAAIGYTESKPTRSRSYQTRKGV